MEPKSKTSPWRVMSQAEPLRDQSLLPGLCQTHSRSMQRTVKAFVQSSAHAFLFPSLCLLHSIKPVIFQAGCICKHRECFPCEHYKRSTHSYKGSSSIASYMEQEFTFFFPQINWNWEGHHSIQDFRIWQFKIVFQELKKPTENKFVHHLP